LELDVLRSVLGRIGGDHVTTFRGVCFRISQKIDAMHCTSNREMIKNTMGADSNIYFKDSPIAKKVLSDVQEVVIPENWR